MCLIIYKPEGAVVPSNYIDNSIEANSDGAGVMWVQDGRVKVAKQLGTKEQLKEFCRQHVARIAGTYVMHHRMSTDGVDNEDNCHPFKVLSIDDGDPIDLYVAHNGIISECKTTRNAERSDTRVYVEDFLRPILKAHPSLLASPAFQAHIKGFIGNGSKLTFLDSNGNVTIINDNAGVWKDTAVATEGDTAVKYWLSNQYSIAERQATTYYSETPWYRSQRAKPQATGTTLPVVVNNTSKKKAQPSSPPASVSIIRRTPGVTYSGKPQTATAKAIDEYLEYGAMGLSDIELADYLIENPPSLLELQDLMNDLDEYTRNSVIMELLDRINSKYYR